MTCPDILQFSASPLLRDYKAAAPCQHFVSATGFYKEPAYYLKCIAIIVTLHPAHESSSLFHVNQITLTL